MLKAVPVAKCAASSRDLTLCRLVPRRPIAKQLLDRAGGVELSPWLGDAGGHSK